METPSSFTHVFEGNHSTVDLVFAKEISKQGFKAQALKNWSTGTKNPLLDYEPPGQILYNVDYNWSRHLVFYHKKTLVLLTLEGTSVALGLAAKTRAEVNEAFQHFTTLFPEVIPEGDFIPVHFWTMTARGPQRVARQIHASAWKDIRQNYSTTVGDALHSLMTDHRADAEGGKLILWHGPAGTGKTHALRSLSRQWGDWCEMHYILDPEQFFAGSADYLFDVILSSHDSEKWKLIVCEDAGEFLTTDAKMNVGQSLTRFLNLCDGIVGQGLRIQLLLTTNEPVQKFHEAVTRPGRIAMELEFKELNARESSEWLGEEVHESHTLAELFAKKRGESVKSRSRTIGLVH